MGRIHRPVRRRRLGGVARPRQRLHRVHPLQGRAAGQCRRSAVRHRSPGRSRSSSQSAQAQYDEGVARLNLANRQLERTNKLRKSDFAAVTELDERVNEAASRQGGRGAGAGGDEFRQAESRIHACNGADQRPHQPASVGVGNLITGGSNGNTTVLTIDRLARSDLSRIRHERERNSSPISAPMWPARCNRRAPPPCPSAATCSTSRNWSLKGNLNFVDNQVDRAAGTIRARAVFANPNAFITPGQFGRIRIPGLGALQGRS